MELTEVNGVAPLWGDTFSNDVLKTTGSAPVGGASFMDIFTSAVENVRTTDQEKNEMEYLLAVGELDNPAQLTIATTKAQVAVELLVQLRTQAMSTHSEIMRMSI